jgi:hypothetical protein
MSYSKILRTLGVCAVVGLTGCGGGGDGPPPSFTTQILSDSSYDGDIQQISATDYVVTQGMSASVQSVYSGIAADGSEFRAFLDFPLTGSGGVPGNASIDSAFLEFYVDDLQFNSSTANLPLRIELVAAFNPPTLAPSDFDRSAQPPLASVVVSPPVNEADLNTFVSVDVTALMVEAQRRGLADFQVRVMEDLGPAIESLMIIDDTTGSDRSKRAPLLTVTYF